MKLVEQHQIKRSHKFFKECDSLCFDSKNLYNYANYIIRQEFINNANYINKFEMQKKVNLNISKSAVHNLQSANLKTDLFIPFSHDLSGM